MPEDLLGPGGFLIGSLLALGALWREHLKADADDRAQRDKALALVEGLIPEVKKLADAATRRRVDDP